MINFAEDNVVLNKFELGYLEYEPLKNGVVIVSKLYQGDFKRINKVYNDFQIIKAMEIDSEPGEFLLTREILEYDMILPSGVSGDTPRKTPTELNYKAKKMKNPFM